MTWNYDLQIEMAYSSFLKNNNVSLQNINRGIKFINDDVNPLDIIHLNGFRGVYKIDNKVLELVDRNSVSCIEDYLVKLIEIGPDIINRQINFEDSIKYAWEHDSETIKNAKDVMKETNILIIIGYSFPSFNRKLDSELIKEFESKELIKVIYQDPNANQDIIKSIFRDTDKVLIEKENIDQFYIPHEFLFPTPADSIEIEIN